jgi:hypothetical protein
MVVVTGGDGGDTTRCHDLVTKSVVECLEQTRFPMFSASIIFFAADSIFFEKNKPPASLSTFWKPYFIMGES